MFFLMSSQNENQIRVQWISMFLKKKKKKKKKTQQQQLLEY